MMGLEGRREGEKREKGMLVLKVHVCFLIPCDSCFMRGDGCQGKLGKKRRSHTSPPFPSTHTLSPPPTDQIMTALPSTLVSLEVSKIAIFPALLLPSVYLSPLSSRELLSFSLVSPLSLPPFRIHPSLCSLFTSLPPLPPSSFPPSFLPR